jgi:excisionase family DNA binding protein
MKTPANEPSPVDAVISEIMNITQVAEYLQTHPSTIYRLLKRRKIPAFRLGSDWRFRRADIENWVAAQEIKVTDEEPAAADTGGQRAARRPAARKPPRARKR